jgi:hypothetical protein
MRRKQSLPWRAEYGLLILFAAVMPGCGPVPIIGGTSGVLTTDGNPIPDVQVTVYPAVSGESLGYAVTRADGSFELIAADSSGPLELERGSYVVTLESVGAPTDLPRAYMHRESTPLRIDWNEAGRLELNVLGLKLK